MSTSVAYLFLSANKPWVYALAERLSFETRVQAVRFYDWHTYLRAQPVWPSVPEGACLQQTMTTLPPGYAGRLEPIFRPYLLWLLRKWQRDLTFANKAPYVIAPYYYLAPWVTRAVPSKKLVYYNLDDYAQYEPKRANQIRAQEAQLVRHAACTLCLSQYQVKSLQRQHPEVADRVHHFPLGVDAQYIKPTVTSPSGDRTVGYIGNLSDRVNWKLVNEVAVRMPSYQFLFVGAATEATASWARERARAFERSNVRHVGPVPQKEVSDYYWSFSINWIPYAVDHPFNKASCPTKIMDAMASGRPIVSTAVPECTLYPEWISIAASPAEVVDQLRKAGEADSRERRESQIAFAKQHTWQKRAEEFTHLITTGPRK